MTIKVITFDLDNTLWDVEPVILNAERKMRTWLHDEVPEFESRFDAHAMMTLRSRVMCSSMTSR